MIPMCYTGITFIIIGNRGHALKYIHLFFKAYQVQRSHYPRTITGLKDGEETSYENCQQCLVVITSCLCVFSALEVAGYFIYLNYVSKSTRTHFNLIINTMKNKF